MKYASTLLAFLILSGAPAPAAILLYGISLSGPNESPANASPGTGSGTVTIDTVGNTMQIQMSFTGLTGTTTAAHIHGATTVALLGNAGVATTTPNFVGFPLGVTSGTFNSTYDMTLAASFNPSYVTANGGTVPQAWAALQTAIAEQKSYFNVHSSTFGGGEIRGFLTPVPEPASTAFLFAGLAGFALRRKRREA